MRLAKRGVRRLLVAARAPDSRPRDESFEDLRLLALLIRDGRRFVSRPGGPILEALRRASPFLDCRPRLFPVSC
jgi:hypothetical protein